MNANNFFNREQLYNWSGSRDGDSFFHLYFPERLPSGTDKGLLQSSSGRRKALVEAGGAVNNNKKLMNIDTDSVNENFSPVRPSTKRKRKFKRMALDPDNTSISMDVTSHGKNKTGTIKRKKVRSRSACESENKSKIRSVTMDQTSNTRDRQRQLSANVVPGKRKRNSREKSVEPDLILHSSQSSIPSHSMISEEVSNTYSNMKK